MAREDERRTAGEAHAREALADSQSRTRDHLANERTYLAWLRTSATVMVLGLAIARFVEEGNVRAVAAGVILVVVGAMGVFEGGWRYRRVSREIEQGRFRTVRGVHEPLIAGFVLTVAIAVALVLLLI